MSIREADPQCTRIRRATTRERTNGELDRWFSVTLRIDPNLPAVKPPCHTWGRMTSARPAAYV